MFSISLRQPRNFTFEEIVESSLFKISSSSMISFEHDPFGWIQTILNKFTGSHNILLLCLMNIRKNRLSYFIHLLFAIILLIPSIILSIVSWFFKSGSNIEIVVIKD